MSRAKSQRTASWVFGSLLFAFFVLTFVFAEPTLPPFKQKMLAFSCALLAGLFTYFLTGQVKIEVLSKKIGEAATQATGGVAVFILVLLWWLSPVAPVTAEQIRDDLDTIKDKASGVEEDTRKILDDLRKVQPGDITARVTYDFYFDETMFEAPPEIFSEGVEFQIVAGAARGVNGVAVGWRNRSLIPDADLVLSSRDVTTDRNVRHTVDGPSTRLIHTYRGFYGKLGAMKDPEVWGTAVLDGLIRVNEQSDWLRQVARDRGLRGSIEDFMAFYQWDARDRERLGDDYFISPLPIRARLQVFVDGQEVAASQGWVASVQEWDEDMRGLHVLKFRAVRTKAWGRD